MSVALWEYEFVLRDLARLHREGRGHTREYRAACLRAEAVRAGMTERERVTARVMAAEISRAEGA
jgi:hypothetical protein